MPEVQHQLMAARLFDEVFERQTPEVCALLMSATAITHTPAGDFAGPAGFEQYVAEVWTTYPNASFAIDEGVIDGDLVTLHWTLGGQQAEQLDGLAILRFEQNMIAESWIEYADATPVEPNVAPELCPPAGNHEPLTTAEPVEVRTAVKRSGPRVRRTLRLPRISGRVSHNYRPRLPELRGCPLPELR